MTPTAVRKRAQRAVDLTGLRCQRCGATDRLHRHHHDYSKPLEVEIVCATCHGTEHAQQRWAGHTKQRMCACCGVTFTYKRARETTCSLSCANTLAWSRRGGKPSQMSVELQPE